MKQEVNKQRNKLDQVAKKSKTEEELVLAELKESEEEFREGEGKILKSLKDLD